MVKNPSANAGDTRDVGSIPGSGRPPGVGNGNPLQYSCLKNPLYRRVWRVIVHMVTKNWTWLKKYIYVYLYKHFPKYSTLLQEFQRGANSPLVSWLTRKRGRNRKKGGEWNTSWRQLPSITSYLPGEKQDIGPPGKRPEKRTSSQASSFCLHWP